MLSFLFLISTNCYSITYVKMNLLECAKCGIYLQRLNNSTNIDTLNFVFEYKLRNDSNELNNILGFPKFIRSKLIFNDSLHQMINNVSSSNGSELFVFNSNSHLIYRTELNDIDIEETEFYSYLGTKPKISLLNNFGNDFFKFERNFLISIDYLSRLTITNINDMSSRRINVDSELIKKVYKSLYRESYEEKFPIMEGFLKRFPGIQPKPSRLAYWNNGQFFTIPIEIYTYEYHGGPDTSLITKKVLGIYDFEKDSFIDFYSLDNKQNNKFIYEIFKLGNRVMAQFGKNVGESVNINDMYFVNFNKKDKTYSLDLNNKPNISPNEYQRNVSSAFRVAFINSKTTLMFLFSDSIYNILDNKEYKIPYNSTFSNAMQGAAHQYDPYSKKFRVIYRQNQHWNPNTQEKVKNVNKDLYIITFSKEGEVLENMLLLNNDGGKHWEAFVLINPYQILVSNKDKNQLEVIDL